MFSFLLFLTFTFSHATFFLVTNVQKSWSEAREYCQENYGGDLAIILNSQQNDEINSLIDASGITGAWLGGSDIAQENTWKWVNGQAFTFTDWYTGEPNNQGSGEDCLASRGSQRVWNDFGCANTNSFVCQTDYCDDYSGIPAINVCCSSACGTCGGTGCGGRPGGPPNCCRNTIAGGDTYCEDGNSAPCKIGTGCDAYQGIPNGAGVCCEEQCGTCGGTGCSGRPGGPSGCCAGIITNNNQFCGNGVTAPCIL